MRDKVCLLHFLTFADQATVQSQWQDCLFGKCTSLLQIVLDVLFELKMVLNTLSYKPCLKLQPLKGSHLSFLFISVTRPAQSLPLLCLILLTAYFLTNARPYPKGSGLFPTPSCLQHLGPLTFAFLCSC